MIYSLQTASPTFYSYLDRIMGEIRKGDDGPLYYNGVEIDNASLSLLQNAIEYALRETKKENILV